MLRRGLNEVVIKGYLKDSELKSSLDAQTKEPMISGSITIAVSEEEEYKVYLWVRKYSKKADVNGTHRENGFYQSVAKLMPDKASTFANALRVSPSITFDEAKSQLTLVRLLGSFEERCFLGRDGDLVTTLNIRGIGAAPITDLSEFTPGATFEVECFIRSIHPEVAKDVETGRLVIGGLVPMYDGSVFPITLVTGSEEAVQYISSHCEEGQTTNFRGNVVSTKIKTVEIPLNSFGQQRPTSSNMVSYVDERQILGGVDFIYNEGDEQAFSKEDISAGLQKREEKRESILKAPPKAKQAAAKTTPPSVKSTPSSNFGKASPAKTAIDAALEQAKAKNVTSAETDDLFNDLDF